MNKSPRCLYNDDIHSFLEKETESIFGILCDNYHGDALTTTREAWKREIEILQDVLVPWRELSPDTENKEEQIRYMLNAYRVLLTRARAGMIICVPEGNDHKSPTGFWEDATRLPEYYDGTYEYLKSIGIEEI